MNNEKDLSAEQSLELISSVIQQAHGNMQKSSFYFILWGFVVAICNFGMYMMMRFSTIEHPYAIWLLTIPAWIITMVHSSRQDRKAIIRTHLDRINMWMWICLGLSMAPVVLFGYKINWQINSFALLLSAIPTFLSGIMLRFKPLLFGGISLYAFAIICFLVDYETQYAVGGIAIVCGYLIPGFLLRSTIEKNV